RSGHAVSGLVRASGGGVGIEPTAAARNGRPPLPVLLAVVVAHFWVHGYRYGSGDHDEMLPQVLHRLDPSLFARDWFVESQAARVTVRTAFVEGLSGAAHLLPLSVV